MATGRVRGQWTAEKLLAAVKQLSPAERAEFQRQLAADADEATLLAQIEQHSDLPPADQRRFNRLRRKHQAEQLSAAEEKDLQTLWQRVEQMNVERLRAFCALARLRGTDVETLLRALGVAGDVNVF